MNATERNEQVVREFTRIFKNEHNVDGISHLFAPDFQHHFTQPLRLGLAGLQDVGRMMNQVFPDETCCHSGTCKDWPRPCVPSWAWLR